MSNQTAQYQKKLEKYVTTIPDFPKEGIQFRDITTILQDADGLQLAVGGLVKNVENIDFDVVVAPEARGFLFGVPLAVALKKGFVPVRKPGKLPRDTVSETYELEYGEDTLEIHKDAILPGQKVVIIDDLLATGGTVEAIVKLVEKLGGQVVHIGFVIELPALQGREKLKNYEVSTLLQYDGE